MEEPGRRLGYGRAAPPSSPPHPSPRPGMKAALLIAHGSRRAEANADLHRLTAMARDRFAGAAGGGGENGDAGGGFDVIEPAFLELADPDIPAGAAACVAAGATDVRMLPYFLSMGTHVAEDLQEFKARFEQDYPGVTFTVCPPLGLHPKLVEVVFERLEG